MTDGTAKTVLWPDLTRFGARLSVAYNPTLGRNLLKLTINDRALFSKMCGLEVGKVDFYDVMRDAGFAYAPSEARSRANAAYDAAQKRGASVEECDRATADETNKFYFYSPSILIKQDLIRKFIPAIVEADFRQHNIGEIKHEDFRYLSAEQIGIFVEQQQRILDAEPGVFFTTPQDRELVKAAESSQVTLNEILEYRDFPPEHVSQRNAVPGELEQLKRFNSVRAVETLMVGQALMSNGFPLKAPRLTATVIGYPSHADAVAANGGDLEGVERVQLPYGVPVGFDARSKRLLILKDVRFLEVPNTLRLQEQDAAPMNVQRHWFFLARLDRLVTLYQDAVAKDLLNEERWDEAGVFAQVEAQTDVIAAEMREAMRAFNPSAQFVSHTDAIKHSGLSASRFAETYPVDFLNFLGQFKNHVHGAVQEKKAALLAQAVFEKGLNAAIKTTRSRQSQSIEGSAPAGRREDAGEKIGGARKDYHKSWLTVEEVASLTVRERSEVVAKDNVWPSLDYAAMREAGVEPSVAWVIRELRHGLPTSPARGGYNTRKILMEKRLNGELSEDMCRNFIDAVSIVRDALADVKTRAELLAAIKTIREKGELQIDMYSDGGGWSYTNGRTSTSDPFPDGAGWKFCNRLLPDISIREGVTTSHGLNRLLYKADGKTQGKWDWAIKEKVAEADEESDESTADSEKKIVRPEPEIPHLDNIVRKGVDYRGGRDIDEATMMEVFGFRGVEYGNWLPQNERQVVLNHAYDAFMDLAAALRLPPKAMSLGGDLAVAFGSRGRGGKNAALAHYEPARNVINLTRLKGAGTLAHEWGHAFDYWLAKAVGVSSIKPVSEAMSSPKSLLNVSPEMRAKWPLANSLTNVIHEATTRYQTKDEAIADACKCGGKQAGDTHIGEWLEQCVNGWIKNLDYCLPEDKRNGVFLEYAQETLKEHFELDPSLAHHNIFRFREPDQFQRKITTALDVQAGKEWREKTSRSQLNYLIEAAQWYGRRVDRVYMVDTNYHPRSATTKSVFLTDAEYYDGFRSKKYWSTRVELFARAFESWVQDRIENSPEVCSQYLVFGRKAAPDAEHSGYPRGEERERVADKMAALFDEHRPHLLKLLQIDESGNRLTATVYQPTLTA